MGDQELQLLKSIDAHLRRIADHLDHSPKKKIQIISGAVEILKDAQRWMSSREIYEELMNVGWTSSAKDPWAAVSGTLSNEVNKDEPRLIRRSSQRIGRGFDYGLPEWKDD